MFGKIGLREKACLTRLLHVTTMAGSDPCSGGGGLSTAPISRSAPISTETLASKSPRAPRRRVAGLHRTNRTCGQAEGTSKNQLYNTHSIGITCITKPTQCLSPCVSFSTPRPDTEDRPPDTRSERRCHARTAARLPRHGRSPVSEARRVGEAKRS